MNFFIKCSFCLATIMYTYLFTDTFHWKNAVIPFVILDSRFIETNFESFVQCSNNETGLSVESLTQAILGLISLPPQVSQVILLCPLSKASAADVTRDSVPLKRFGGAHKSIPRTEYTGRTEPEGLNKSIPHRVNRSSGIKSYLWASVNCLPRRLSIVLRTRTIKCKWDPFSRGIISYVS